MNTKKTGRGNWPNTRLMGLKKRNSSAPKEPEPENQSSPQPSPVPPSESTFLYVPEPSAEIIELDDELISVQTQQLAWPFSPPELSQEPMDIPPIDESRYWDIMRKFGRWALLVICILLAAVPSFLVFLDRWMEVRDIADMSRDSWCRVQFLCNMWWPSYFQIIIPASILLVLLVVFTVLDKRPHLQTANVPKEDNNSRKNIRPAQLYVSRILEGIAFLWVGILVVLGVTTESLPGFGLLMAILIYLFARVLREFSSGYLLVKMRNWWLHAWPIGLTQLALLIFLTNLSNRCPTSIITFILFAAAIYNLWRHRAQVNAIHWITIAAIFLFSININSWFFSTVGDEYGFFSYAQDIVQYQSWGFRSSHFFNGLGVYDSHAYLSSVFQALSMALFGVNNFGWRFSSIYLAALAIPMFYFFFRRFLDERIALLGAGMLGCSHYLMTFGKIGYNNLQALFVMALVLWAAGEAVNKRRLINYTLLGLSLGLIFYVYPAAYYVIPLAGVLMLMYDPPFNKASIQRWAMTAISFLLVFFPLFFQPIYWEHKVAGTLFYNPDVVEQGGGIAMHLLRNFLYSLYSFIYIVQESHFVVSSYVDPVSGMLVLLGLAWVFNLIRRDRFAVYILLGFFLLNFFVGATHDRMTPSNTRMFLLLPWFTLLASLGLSWLTWQFQRLKIPSRVSTGMIITLLSLVLIGNIYQAYGLSYQRNAGQPTLEAFFIRMLQRNDRIINDQYRDAQNHIYLFITPDSWDIGGLRVAQQVYGVPDSSAQLQRVAVTSGELPAGTLEQIKDQNVGVIIYPYIDENWRTELEATLTEMGRKPCVIRNTLQTDPRFTIWWSNYWWETCPNNGDWSMRW